MNITRLKFGIISATLLAGAAGLFVNQYRARVNLVRENAALRQELEKSAQLATENERLSKLLAQAQSAGSGSNSQRSELIRLRGEVGRLRRQAQDAEAVREQSRQSHAALAGSPSPPATGASAEAGTADFWPKDSWRFQGYATPDAALQSQFYAASQGDITNFLASITDKMKEKVEKDLADKSEAEIAAKFNKEMEDLQSARVLDRKVFADDSALLTIAFQGPKQKGESQLLLKKIGNDWKLADVTRK